MHDPRENSSADGNVTRKRALLVNVFAFTGAARCPKSQTNVLVPPHALLPWRSLSNTLPHTTMRIGSNLSARTLRSINAEDEEPSHPGFAFSFASLVPPIAFVCNVFHCTLSFAGTSTADPIFQQKQHTLHVFPRPSACASILPTSPHRHPSTSTRAPYLRFTPGCFKKDLSVCSSMAIPCTWSATRKLLDDACRWCLAKMCARGVQRFIP
mmetsp:Transcript_7664/g.47315  ORF Transcript_7664/g.47315 Transcript_7664/m.47315 type:complete len:211 (+) Transcript_7664:1399-2031(+)